MYGFPALPLSQFYLGDPNTLFMQGHIKYYIWNSPEVNNYYSRDCKPSFVYF